MSAPDPPPGAHHESWTRRLEELDAAHLRRRLRVLDPPQQPAISVDGRLIVNFASNDYLGLAAHPALRETAARAARDFGVGSGASRLVCGNFAPHAALDARLAAFKRSEAALTFSSGYATALGVIPALAGADDVIILDKLCHACLVDGARLSGAMLRVFPHNNLDKLESHLAWARNRHPKANVLVVTEAVFSMDGDRAPLAEILDLKSRFGAALLLDEAHAVGLIGPGGRGLAEELDAAGGVDVQMGTLSKAVGTAGGYVCGSRTLIDLLINRARSFIYSTAPPPFVAEVARHAIDLVESSEGDARRKTLWSNIHHLVRHLPPPPIPAPARAGQSAIVPWILGPAQDAVSLSSQLEKSGFLIPAIRFPTVARGMARLRVTLSAAHSTADIDRLCSAWRC